MGLCCTRTTVSVMRAAVARDSGSTQPTLGWLHIFSASWSARDSGCGARSSTQLRLLRLLRHALALLALARERCVRKPTLAQSSSPSSSPPLSLSSLLLLSLTPRLRALSPDRNV
jgi:hypothetical protein